MVVESGCNGYTQVGFRAPSYSKIDIYGGWRNLIARGVYEEDQNKFKPLVPRDTDKDYFSFVVTSPVFKGTKHFRVVPKFLDNKELLEKIVEADFMWEADLGKRFTYFHLDVDYERINDNTRRRGVPKGGYIGFYHKGIEYYYEIDGLEVLIGGDKELFAKYWNSDFKSFEDFKKFYDKVKK